MKILTRSLLIASIVASVALLPACSMETQKHLSQGQVYFQQKNYPQAFNTLLPLAQKGNADAQYAVGYMYFYGLGTPQDTYLAQKWMRKSAAQGQPLAIKALAQIQRKAGPSTQAMFSTTGNSNTAATSSGNSGSASSSASAGSNNATNTRLPNYPGQ